MSRSALPDLLVVTPPCPRLSAVALVGPGFWTKRQKREPMEVPQARRGPLDTVIKLMTSKIEPVQSVDE